MKFKITKINFAYNSLASYNGNTESSFIFGKIKVVFQMFNLSCDKTFSLSV